MFQEYKINLTLSQFRIFGRYQNKIALSLIKSAPKKQT